MQTLTTKLISVFGFFIIFSFLFSSCSLLDSNTDKDDFIAIYDMSQLPVSDLFDSGIEIGLVDNPEIDEISGMVTSQLDSDIVWVHNDSGDESRIFLLRKDGTYLKTIQINGASNRDWEDIAYGPGPDENLNYIYIAEIGDNSARYDVKMIYRFPEPSLSLENDLDLAQAESISFVYPNDIRMDAETLLLDPWTRDIFIVTKREFPVKVYRLPYPQSTTDTIIAELYGMLPFTSATAGDISKDGKDILIKNYQDIYLWSREDDETLADAFLKQPLRLNYVQEPQGEAIAFTQDGNAFYTISEKRNDVTPVVYYYGRKQD